jgi:hypothetical protein
MTNAIALTTTATLIDDTNTTINSDFHMEIVQNRYYGTFPSI